jgi:hypothetical protein
LTCFNRGQQELSLRFHRLLQLPDEPIRYFALAAAVRNTEE